MSLKKIFIDGEHGTTGLRLKAKLAQHPGVEVISIDPRFRKDNQAKVELFQEADVSILCLPDEAARKTALLAQGTATRIIDASSSHRTDQRWTYGLPELSANQRELIRASRAVANPGCFATAAILLLKPLIEGRLLGKDTKISINAVSGYSGGGREMIDRYESDASSDTLSFYALRHDHKHLPEITAYTGLKHMPIFTPSVARFYQGMVVMIPLHFEHVTTAAKVLRQMTEYYADENFVNVAQSLDLATLDTKTAVDSNFISLHLMADQSFHKTGRLLLVAKLDNLGKGAATAAIQNMNIMLGFPEGLSISGE